MEGEVAENPLAVRDLKKLRDELFGLVLAVEVAVGHGQMEGLNGIKVSGDVAFREFPPSDGVLTGRQHFKLR